MTRHRVINIIIILSFLNIYCTPSHFFDFPLCDTGGGGVRGVDRKNLTCSIETNKKSYCTFHKISSILHGADKYNRVFYVASSRKKRIRFSVATAK